MPCHSKMDDDGYGIFSTRPNNAGTDVGAILHMTAPEVKPFQTRSFAPPSRCDQRSHKGLDLDTTAEFRNFVAKKLYESLERRIKFKKVVKETAPDAEEGIKSDSDSDWGFRLLSSSVSNSKTVIAAKPGKRVRSKSTSSDSDSHEKLASVAVDLQTILDDRTMLNKFRAKEKVKSDETDHKQQTEESVQLSASTNDQTKATIPKDKKKKKVHKSVSN